MLSYECEKEKKKVYASCVWDAQSLVHPSGMSCVWMSPATCSESVRVEHSGSVTESSFSRLGARGIGGWGKRRNTKNKAIVWEAKWRSRNLCEYSLFFRRAVSVPVADGFKLSKSEMVAHKPQLLPEARNQKEGRWERQEDTGGQQKQCARNWDHTC